MVKKSIRCLTLAFLPMMLAAGCADQPTGLSAPSEPRRSIAYSDAETMFRGIIFGEGTIANAIPEIRDNYKMDLLATSDLSTATMSDIHHRILTRVNTIDPGFLGRFKTAMNSGDQVQISDMLNEASLIVVDALEGTTEGDTLRYYEASPTALDARMQPVLDGNGYLQLGDTSVTPSQTSNEFSTQIQQEYHQPGWGGCDDPKQIICDQAQGAVFYIGGIVYVVAAVHVLAVYNVYAAVTWGRWVAVPRLKNWAVAPTLMREQLVNSLANNLRL